MQWIGRLSRSSSVSLITIKQKGSRTYRMDVADISNLRKESTHPYVGSELEWYDGSSWVEAVYEHWYGEVLILIL
jgi:hypothetical protein